MSDSPTMMPLVDTHAHLTDARFADDVDEVVERARAAGVRWLVSIASDVDDALRAIALSERLPEVYATAGIHPHAASGATDGAFDRLHRLAGNPRVVAIGETGLDFHYDNSPRAEQIESFERHLALAAEVDLPVVVHARSADAEVRAAIEAAGWRRGVLHCFSGGDDLLEAALGLGWYISFAGMVTFPNWTGAEQLRSVPIDRLLVETDSPYLAPVPHRGRRNEPAHVGRVVERVAELRGEDVSSMAAATTTNAARFYGLPHTS